jgi:hypothetical protein
MAHTNFLVAQGFATPADFNVLGTFIKTKDRVDKARSLQPDRCLEFMLYDDKSIELLCKKEVIYARPASISQDKSSLRIVIRNIVNYGQLQIIASLITHDRSDALIRSLRSLEPSTHMNYELDYDKSIVICAAIRFDPDETVIFDGKKM